MVLAIGSLMDTKRTAYNIEAEKYHQLARAALFQSPIFEEPTLFAVQVLVGHFLNAYFHSSRSYSVPAVSHGVLPFPLRKIWQWGWIAMGVDGPGSEARYKCERDSCEQRTE